MVIDSSTTPRQIATWVSTALQRAGIKAVLSGGAAISHRYVSHDLDFVCDERTDVLANAIEPLGFMRGGSRHFEHPNTDYFIEFPPGPLAAGETVFEKWEVLKTEWGTIHILSPTQMVMDRLAAYFHWNDPQSLDQALMVAESNELDWPSLDAWAEREREPDQYEIFQRSALRPE